MYQHNIDKLYYEHSYNWGGFAGCSSAEMLSKLHGANITIVEKSNYLGAGVRTFLWRTPLYFGPRHFLTQNKDTYDYLSKFLELRNCNYHQFKSYVADDKFYNYPLNQADINVMPDKSIIKKELNKSKRMFIRELGRILDKFNW